MKRILQTGALAIAVLGSTAAQSWATTYSVAPGGAVPVAVSAGDNIGFGNTVSTSPNIDEYQFTTASAEVVSNTTASNSSGTLDPFTIELVNVTTSQILGTASSTSFVGLSNIFLAAGDVFALFVTTEGTGFYNGNISLATAPVPATLPFLATGLLGLWAWRRRSQSAA